MLLDDVEEIVIDVLFGLGELVDSCRFVIGHGNDEFHFVVETDSLHIGLVSF